MSLHEACYQGRIDVVAQLLASGADPNEPADPTEREWISGSGNRPRPLNCVAIAWEMTENHVEIAKLLIEHGAVVDDSVIGDHEFERASLDGTVDVAFARLLEAALEELNKEIVIRFIEELDKGNIENALELFDPYCLWYEPHNSPTPWSKEEALEHMKMLYDAFPKWQRKIEEIITAGNKVIARTVDSTTHEKEIQGIPATGNLVEVGVITIFSIGNGKIFEMREQLDKLGWAQQLGMELKPKEEK